METTSSFICPQPSLISKSCCTSCTGWFFTWMSQHGHKAQLAAEYSAEPGWIKLETATSRHQTRFTEAIQRSVISAQSSFHTKCLHHTQLHNLTWTDRSRTHLAFALRQCNSTQHMAFTGNTSKTQQWGLSWGLFVFLLWIHLILIRLCHIFMPLPAVFSHWDFA